MNDAGSTERALVERVREGDEHALGILFDRCEQAALGRVQGKLPKSLSRKVDPEDILQDARLVAALRFKDFEGLHEGSFAKWFCGIAEHKLRETLRYYLDVSKRDAHLERTRGARPDTRVFRARHTTPSMAAMRGEFEAHANVVLAQLPADYRRVFELVQTQDRSLREAADEMGRSYEATKKLYQRALARLEELMTPP